MLELAIHSLNKRAKNCRDKKNEYYYKAESSGYRNYYNYDTVAKYKEREQELYAIKDFLLKEICKPVCVHKQITKKESVKTRFYDYQTEYGQYEGTEKVIYGGSYWDNDEHEQVYFIDVVQDETTNYSFHTPIDELDLVNYNQLEVIVLPPDFSTKGQDINDLMSLQFASKIVELVKTGDYKYNS